MKHIVIYVPGLNDTKFVNTALSHFLPLLWKMYGFEIIIFQPRWGKGNLKEKLNRILQLIDSLKKTNTKIYLVGQSAGGSFVLNVFSLRTDSVARVVNIGGRLLKGNHGFPLSIAAKNSIAFKESVLTFENKNNKKLTVKDKKKILIIRPIFDEIVPKDTITIEGVKMQTIPTIEHTLSGIAACTFFSPIIFKFLNSRK
jgi:hypothetical protein